MSADEPDSDWVQDARTERAALLRAARHATAEAALRAADPETARRVAEAAVRADRLDEAAHRLLMAAHQAAGDPNRALMVHRGLSATLAGELGSDPAPQTRHVHEAVLADRSVMPQSAGERVAPTGARTAAAPAGRLVGRAGRAGPAHRGVDGGGPR